MADKMIDFTSEVKKRERQLKVEQLKQKASRFWNDNRDTIIPLVPVVGGLIGIGFKTLGKHHNLKLEKYNKDRYVYDTSLGHYWELKRKLKNSEWVEIERRRKRGERLADILSNMRVLK